MFVNMIFFSHSRPFQVVRLVTFFPSLIPAPADCGLWLSFWKRSGAGCLVPVLSCCTITRGHTRLSCRSSAGRCLIIIHLIARTSRPVITIFSFTSEIVDGSVFWMTERRRWVSQWFQFQAADFCERGIQKLVPRHDKFLNSGGKYVEKLLNTCCVCSNKSFHCNGVCFCKRPRETYFVDAYVLSVITGVVI